MRIGDMAQATGLSRDTLRFYEKRGLLHARRGANGYRDYPLEAVDWLRYLRTAQQLGFTLAEIEADMPLLAAADAPETAALLRTALTNKLADIDARIAGLSQLRAELARRLGTPMRDCPLQGVDHAAG
ncbi:MerR family transcriptional regulator [Janthinobacterium sp. J1-1]|uniref:MerR family transcriptional regulator n=1 Tax=unclassified Janthinobacterium TaxID=2610881 RepID=UPI002810EC73|nr:MerR family transcriptional regulator [Janthinobacterium sp. J1-1]